MRGAGEAVGAIQVGPRQPHDAGIDAFDDCRIPELPIAAQKGRARAGLPNAGQRVDEFVLPCRCDAGSHTGGSVSRLISVLSLKSQLVQGTFETFQAAAADEPDGAGGQAEARRQIAVRDRLARRTAA